MITAVTFKDGRAFFRNRFVKTKGAQNETTPSLSMLSNPCRSHHR